jgi:hypothetical protein
LGGGSFKATKSSFFLGNEELHMAFNLFGRPRNAPQGGGGAVKTQAAQARQQQSAAESIQELSKVITMMEKRCGAL